MSTIKIYVASTLSNHERVRRIIAKLEAKGVTITYKWCDHNDGAHPKVTDPERLIKIAQLEEDGVSDAHAVLVVMPGGLGTHYEMGFARGRDTAIVLLNDVGFEGPSFHQLPKVQKFTDEDAAIDAVIKAAREYSRRLHRSM